MKNILLITVIIFFANKNFAQNAGIGTAAPDPSAMLEINAAHKGLLIPRISLTGINDAVTIPSPVHSLLIYNRATTGSGNTAVTPGFYYWDNLTSTWIRFNTASNNQAVWSLTGNTNTASNANFIGTADNQSLLFKINSSNAGYLGTTGNTYWGLNSGNVNSTGFSNVAVGSSALSQTTNRSNLVAVGDSALYNNGSGAAQVFEATGNTALGSKTLFANTKGYFNTAVGARALFADTTGSYNTATGYQSLFTNSNGINNTAGGYQSLFANSTGNSNTANGYQSLGSNTAGSNNTANGQYALVGNTTGSNNTANGTSSLLNNTSGHSNVAVGINALYVNTTGSNLVAVGDSSLYYNGVGATAVQGKENTAIGSKALFSNTIGNSNTALGASADVAAENLNNATAIGSKSFVNCSNCMVLGSINGLNGAASSVKVGIGTPTPLMGLHVAKTDSAVALFENTQALNINISNALYFKTGSGAAPYTGAIKTIGESANAARLGLYTYASTSTNQLLERLSITDAGKVGISTINPIMKLHIVNTDSAVALLENTQTLNTNVSNALYFKTGNGLLPYTGALKTIGENTGAARLGLFTSAAFTANGLLERLSITDNGNTGIGTTLPLMNLHVSSADSAVALLENTQTLNTNISNALYFKTGNGLFSYTGAIKTIGETPGTARIGLFTFTSASGNGLKERMSITDAGNIGIGIINPQTNFHLNPAGAGSFLIGTNKFSGGYTNMEMGITAQSNGYGYIQTTKASGSAWGNLSINESGGAVGIGTSQLNPSAKLTVGVNTGVGGAFSGIVATGNGHIDNAAITAIGTNNAAALTIDGPIRSLNNNSKVIYKMTTQTISATADGYLDDTFHPGVPGLPEGHVIILINNPLCNGDPTAMIFYSWIGYYERNKNFQSFLVYDSTIQRWTIKYYYDTYTGPSNDNIPELNIMIVKQ